MNRLRRSTLLYTTLFVVLFALTLSSVYAYDTRLFGLNSPTLSQSAAAALAGINVVFPTDEFGLGLSAIPDTFDIWKLPARLADPELFPSSMAVVEFTDVNEGNGGVVLALEKLPLTIGAFVLRPDRNTWVTGSARNAFINRDYYATAVTAGPGPLTANNVEPNAPSNIADVFAALKFGNIMVGAGAGYAYDKAADASSSTVGTPDTGVDAKATSSVFTIRAGASVGLDVPLPLAVDVGLLFPMSKYDTTYEEEPAAGTDDDSITADNKSLSISGRVTAGLLPKADVVLLVDYASLPQDFTVKDDGVKLTNTVLEVDSTKATSFGIGTGINWMPREGTLLNCLVSYISGKGEYTSEAAGPGNRPDDSRKWKTLEGVIDGEFLVSQKLILRGGIGGSMSWLTAENNEDTGGTDSETTTFSYGTSAAAGVGFQITESVLLDFVVNLDNWATASFLQTLSTRAAMQVEL